MIVTRPATQGHRASRLLRTHCPCAVLTALLGGMPIAGFAQDAGNDVGDGHAQEEPLKPQDDASPVQARGAENAITQAEDAFGFSAGKESLGLYTTSNVRGFSPVAAGNVRIEGLYFDQVFRLTNRISQSTSIKVGFSAHGSPFPSPTGVVDYRLYKPGDTQALSALVSLDSYGTRSVEADAVIPLAGDRLSLGIGFYNAGNASHDGTDNIQLIQGAAINWRPTLELEIVPFWTRSEIRDDERSPQYVPAGPFLPPDVALRRFHGPAWVQFNSVGISEGVIVGYAPSSQWRVRAGLFRSELDDTSDFGHLLTNLQPDGRADRVIIADPQSLFTSTSGELRVSRSFAEGERLHLLHASIRARNRFQRYGGSDVLEYGPTGIADTFISRQPDFEFTDQTRDRVRQWTAGLAYEGRWPELGELSFGLSRTDYQKEVHLPGLPAATTESGPWLYYGTLVVDLAEGLSAYAGYTRGLEESGVAPENALNRNAALPAILTSQREAGLRYALTNSLVLVAGAFDLKKPYYNLDQTDRFALLGDVRNRGLEVSVAGALASNLDVVAGAVLRRPEVTGEGVLLGRVGPRPVGLPKRTIMLNADWRVPFLEKLSFDVAVARESRIISTRDNLVSIPARTLVDVGGRYRFNVGAHEGTLRFRVTNLTGEKGFTVQGAGAYQVIPGRMASLYLAMDFQG